MCPNYRQLTGLDPKKLARVPDVVHPDQTAQKRADLEFIRAEVQPGRPIVTFSLMRRSAGGWTPCLWVASTQDGELFEAEGFII